MSGLLFIGDEVSAAGFRLAGLDVLVPEPGKEHQVLDQLKEHTELIIITAQTAAAVPQQTMDKLMLLDKPLLLVITDMREQSLAPDLSVSLRSQLGLAE